MLLVIFVPGTPADTRSAVAESVQGKLVRPPGSEGFDSYYLQFPGGETDSELRAVTDQLIQFAEVQQVGTKACPESQ